MSNRAYLSLGSNIQPEVNLLEAVRMLKQFGQVLAISSVWETYPAVFSEQANFLNMAVLLDTELSLATLRAEAIAAIEAALKRVRTANKHGPRTIDIDITLFNHEVVDLGVRHIPDDNILRFAYVAIPLAEIAPNYVHPEAGRTIQDIAKAFANDPALIARREDLTQLTQSLVAIP